MTMHDNYADDLAVDPRFQGCRVGKALVCAVAARLATVGHDEMTLDVRACNLPALALYRSLGFQIVRKHFPGFYDWHGGYRMAAPVPEVLTKMPKGFDLSSS